MNCNAKLCGSSPLRRMAVATAAKADGPSYSARFGSVEAAAAVARHYGIAGLYFAGHPALARDSKSGRAFASGQREADLAAAEAAYGEEIAQVLGWAKAVADTAGVRLEGAAPLSV